ncbi:MAG: hypothetical protein LBS10_04905, partial [Gracilibacteraceae bacterium]|nr:hypothetical protein [Gracilibacteraceae bacterium]
EDRVLADRNELRYGAKTWTEALMKLQMTLLTGTSEETRTQAGFSAQAYNKQADILKKAEIASAQQERRLADLRSRSDGIFAEIIPFLLRRREDARILSVGDDESFRAYASALEERLSAPLELLSRQLPFHRQQIYREYGDVLADPRHKASAREWRPVFDSYVRQIDALETGSSPSIDKWIARASSSFIAPYVMELLLADASLISGSEDQINQKLFVAQGRIQENLKALNDLCAGPPNVTFFSSAAQREGFRQFLRHEIALEKAGVFSSRLADRLRDFKARVSTDARQVRQSSEAMEEKARAAAAIDQEKLAGYNAWSRMNEPLAELKENMRSGVSPLALQLNAPEAETPNQERVEATRKALTLPPYASYSAEVNSALLEHSLLVVLPEEEIEFYKNKPENKKKKNKAALELDLAIARLAKTRLLEGGLNDLAQRLKEGSVQGLSALPAERAAPFLLYVSLCGALVERKYPDEQVARLYEDFAQKLEALHDLRALAQKGAVLEQGDTTLAREHKEAVGALAYGFYHLARKDFCDSVHTQLDYFTRSAALIQQIGAVLEEAQIPATRCAALNLGFRYYFQARLLGASLPDPDALGAEMRALLEDRAKLEFIEAGDFEKTEIDLFDQRRVSTVGYLSRELTPYTLANREDLADFLSRSDEGRWKQHGALTAEQRQLFGLVLGVPGILREADEILPSMAPVYSEADRRAAQRDLRQQVEAYINREAFNPVVDYATALRQLRDSNGELDGAVFDTAMQFTQLCIQRRQAKEEKDWDRLANPMESVAYRGGQTRVRELSDMPMENRSHLMDALRRKVMAASESGARKNALSLLKKADALNPAAFALLVRVLQDRTMIDRTTGVSRLDRSKGAIHGFANEDARQEVKEQYLNDEAAFTASSASLRRALFTLHSYQLRDDQKLTTGYLQAADFADGALARREDVDWSLLERALDFVKEMHREGLRLQVIQQATSSSLIEQSPNEKVRALYEATGRGASVQSREALEEQLLEQADADGQLAALAGYHALEAPEKALLIKALARRDILDVSKQDIYLNRFGYMERDYANPRARDALIDQYFNFPGDLENLQAEDFTAALRGCLSSQVYDRTKSTDLTAALGAGDAAVAAVLSKRGTAIDWKLFGRALQLVRRAQNERKVFEQERELYRAQGDVEGQGAFRYNAHFARKNVHNAGNRFTRFVGRRASAAVMEEIPAPFLKLMRVALPLEVSNQINSMEPLKPEESDLLEHIDTVAGLVSDFAGMEAVGAGITHIFSESVATNLADSSGYVSTAIGVIGDVKTVVESTVSKKKLRNAREEGREVQEKDDARTEAAEKEQSEEERELAREASARNVLSAEMGLDKASQRMNDELINAMASLVSAGVGVAAVVPGGAVVEKLVEIAIREAGEFVNFLRNYFNDIESIEKYFEKENKVLPAYRAKLGELMKARGKTDEQVEAALRGIKVRELACDALGFENYTELASFVGLNITRSLLFCAGKQNPQLRTQIQAKAALAVIDCEEAIGKQDDESALQVYNAIMGGKYR